MDVRVAEFEEIDDLNDFINISLIDEKIRIVPITIIELKQSSNPSLRVYYYEEALDNVS